MASYRKKGNYWYYRVSYKDADKKKTKEKGGFRTKKEAQLAAAKLEAEIHSGTNVYKQDIMFLDYYEQWYTLYKKDKFSLETNRNYTYAINVAEKFFKNVRLKNMNRETYQRMINDYAKTHSYETVKKLNSMFRACFNDAVHAGDLPRSPAYKVTLSGLPPKRESDKYLNEFEAKALIESVLDGIRPSYVSRYMILLALASGARYAEIIGLTTDCVDFENNTIKIDKTWNYRDLNDFSTTKNESSIRSLQIDGFTMDKIKELIVSRSNPHPRGLIFVDKNDEPISSTGVNKALRKALMRAKIEANITFHSLRHTHGSLLLLHDTSLIYVSKRLGHSNMETTANIYSHLVKELNEKGNQISDSVMDNLYT